MAQVDETESVEKELILKPTYSECKRGTISASYDWETPFGGRG